MHNHVLSKNANKDTFVLWYSSALFAMIQKSFTLEEIATHVYEIDTTGLTGPSLKVMLYWIIPTFTENCDVTEAIIRNHTIMTIVINAQWAAT